MLLAPRPLLSYSYTDNCRWIGWKADVCHRVIGFTIAFLFSFLFCRSFNIIWFERANRVPNRNLIHVPLPSGIY